ncbi:MAG: YbhB/YbcL family Raf kinase inhibitor-like protein [Acetobacteraceae bacterium]|nr:YbhB/YbcL family Raf kinase inhibitor-like protein [Acetobacteraceae bacterium]
MPARASFARSLGWALQPLRPGAQAFASRRRSFEAVPASIVVTSPAFSHAGPIPLRYTREGEGLSPPLRWSNLPEGTASLVLLVEDADAPTLRPLVHAILCNIPPVPDALAEGAIPHGRKGAAPDAFEPGRNSVGRRGWLPISPPLGHGPHRYGFEFFALDRMMEIRWPPGRGYLLRSIRPYLLAHGCLVGICQRK